MKRASRIVSALLSTAVLLGGCSSGGSGSGTAASSAASAASASAGTVGNTTTTEADIPAGTSISQDQDVVAAVAVDFTTMDPVDTSDTLSGGIQRLMMDGLFGFDDDMNLIPMLATDYTANDDATQYVITLREGITFSDGEAWNAEAAKKNFDKLTDKDLHLKRTSLLSNVIESTEVTGEYEITVNLSSPFGAFIATLAHPACVMEAPSVIDAGLDEAAHNPIGTGQYTFGEWVEGDHLTINLNKDWWGYDAGLADSDAGFKSITFRPVSEAATRVSMLQAGDADFIWPVPAESYETLAADSTINAYAEEGIVVYYLTMNTQKEPFTDIRVRQAINYAIDKDAYISVVMHGLGSKATSIIAPKVAYYKGNDPYEYDPDKAKELLAEAGYPDGFTVDYYYTTTTDNQNAAQFIQQQLAAVGITVNLIGNESAITNSIIQDETAEPSEAKVDIYRTGWSPSTGDADWGIRPLLGSESFPPNNYNISYYSNSELDQYIADGLSTADSDKRAEAYEKAQDLIWEEVPIAPLANSYNTWATTDKLAGVKIYPDGAINIRNARMGA